MHDFDTEQRKRHDELQSEFGDHSFTLRGQEFHVRRIIPFAAIEAVAAVDSSSDDLTALIAVKKAIYGLLDGGAEARQRLDALLEDFDDPVTFGDLQQVMNWMIGEAAGRPPTQPESSSPSPSANGSGSTENSSSTPAEASTT